MLKLRILMPIMMMFLGKCAKGPITEPPAQQYKLFFVGDSITSDDPGNISLVGTTSSKSWPWEMKQILNDDTKYQFRDWAVSGDGFTQMQTQVNNIIAEKDSTKVNICYLLGPINNITFNSWTGSQAYTNMRTLHEQLRAAGIKTVAISLTSRRQLAFFTETQSEAFWVEISAFNDLMIAHWSEFSDAYINLQSDPERVEGGQTVGFGGYAAATESIYFADGVHWATPGKQWMAQHYAIPALTLIQNNQTGVVSY